MDKLYVGDIPQEYHFAKFSNNYIDLYNSNVLLPNTTYTFYRVYLYDNLFFYDTLQTTTSSYYSSTYTTEIETTNDVHYRRDFSSILIITLIIAVFGIWLFNILSSAIRKGGGLGGLL